jgi:hypothetical protein
MAHALATALPYGRNVERSSGKRSQQLSFGFGQVKPSRPVLGADHDDLPVVIGSYVRSGPAAVVSIVNVRGWLPCAAFHRPARTKNDSRSARKFARTVAELHS